MIFLDVAEPIFSIKSNYSALWLHFMLTVLIEGGILYAFKYKPIRNSLIDAFILNLSSLLVGAVLFLFFESALSVRFETKIDILYLFFLYLLTLGIEGGMLHILHKEFPLKKMILANIAMNTATYLLLYFMLNLFFSYS